MFRWLSGAQLDTVQVVVVAAGGGGAANAESPGLGGGSGVSCGLCGLMPAI